ncbi:MAG: sensor histidine kinase [Pseudomonadota bacterium]
MQAHHSLIDVMPNAVILVDNQGVVEHCNDNAKHLLDSALIGKLWRHCVAENFSPQADDWHEISLRSGHRVKVDISALQGQDGQLVVLTDLTETRRLQEKISHLQRLSSMGRMVASLAHQIRTPLSAAILYAHNLTTDDLPLAKQKRFSEKLLSRLHSLEQQVNDMLLFAKSGDKQVLQVLPAGELIDSVLASVKPYAENKHIDIKLHLDSCQIDINANKVGVSGAIQNLVTNAIDASQPGQQIILKTAHNGGDWLCSVIDNGAGIPAEIEQQLLTPFVTSKANGTGLGLAVVNTVVKSHQGSLQWVSEPDKGTEFTVSFPIYQQHGSVDEVCYG